MSFNRNTNVIGKHAFLSPSTYNWLEQDEDKLRSVYFNRQQTLRGDQLHNLAKDLITLGVRLPATSETLNMYVNDAIGFGMEPEVPLYYSEDCFGTCDAICIRDEILRIHDLKTGITPANMKQLLIYCGIFFHEYKSLFRPQDLRVILRIYQNDGIEELQPEVSDILWVMDRIKTQAELIAYFRGEVM